MTSRDFCYWLQGYFELTEAKGLCAAQVEAIERHLAMVFTHEIDPSMGPRATQSLLDAIHTAKPHIGGEVEIPYGPKKYRC